MTSTNGRATRVAGLAAIGADASPSPATGPVALTARERDVARMIAEGQTNRRIAAVLALSGRTVEWHVGKILRKLGLRSRLQIALWALHDGDDPPRT